MSTAKPSRRRTTQKLEPIDWREFANDAVLNGNMSTLYHRPPDEDPTAYASQEALLEIRKRTASAVRPVRQANAGGLEAKTQELIEGARPTVGVMPTVGPIAAGGEAGCAREGSTESGSGNRADNVPTVGLDETVGLVHPDEDLRLDAGGEPTAGVSHAPVRGDVRSPARESTVGSEPAVGPEPTVGLKPTVGIVAEGAADPNIEFRADRTRLVLKSSQPLALNTTAASTPTVGAQPTVGVGPAVGVERTVGVAKSKKVKAVRDVQDALTLAGQVLYKAMYGAPDGAKSKVCTKGYRQLAAETHLDKDTVRDLIGEFKAKGIVREIGTYDPDTRSAKTYDVLSFKAILQLWRESGLLFVTAGRQRPTFCDASGNPVSFAPTVGLEPTVGSVPPVGAESGPRKPTVGAIPTVGPVGAGRTRGQRGNQVSLSEVIVALQQITGIAVDQEAAEQLIRKCRAEAADCTTEEIVEFAWSKSFMCRSGKIANPVGFLITQLPKHFQPESIAAYRARKAKELEAAETAAAQDAVRQEAADRQVAELERAERSRTAVAERYRTPKGIDVKAVLEDGDTDEGLRQWAERLLKLGRKYASRY